MRRLAHWLAVQLAGPKRVEDVIWWCSLVVSVVLNTIALSVDEPARTTFAVCGAVAILLGVFVWTFAKRLRSYRRDDD